MKDTSSIILHGVATIGETSPLLVVNQGNIDWKSSEELPTEPGEYKLK